MRSLITCALFLVTLCAAAQFKYPQKYFRSPVDIPMYLSGNFGEIRPNHFHAGLDIKTQGVIGKNIYACADGYVSRIKISPWGYGKVVYIDHPNGFTTVYAHLSKFSDKIEKYIHQRQLENESWEVDVYPDSIAIPVTKGEIIAKSGSSGSSLAPHLHFEIRETVSERVINPLLFGMDIKDNIKPIFKSAMIYTVRGGSINGKWNTKYPVSVTGKAGVYKRAYQIPIKVSGDIGIGVEVEDRINGSGNRNGIYSIKLYVDDQLYFSHEMEKFAFNESRYSNSHMDFTYKLDKNKRIQKCFPDPNNRLSVYQTLENNGVIRFDDDKLHKVRIVTKDVYGNQSELNFDLQAQKYDPTNDHGGVRLGQTIPCKSGGSFSKDGFFVEISDTALYKDLQVSYAKRDTFRGAISPTYRFNNDRTPVHAYIDIGIKANVSKALKDKCVISRFDSKGRYYGHKGEWRGDVFHIQTKYFGDFCLMTDTKAPVITPVNISEGKYMGKNKTLIVRAADNLAGIVSYKGYIDGKFVIMEYKPRKAQMIYRFGPEIKPGDHTFKMVVKDAVGNESTYEAKFRR